MNEKPSNPPTTRPRSFTKVLRGVTAATREAKTIHVHGHCHQKALASIAPTLRMLSLPENFTVHEIPSGCCGMAGSFGYEKEHYDVSMQVGSLVLFPVAKMLDPSYLIAAAGTSCRHQLHDGVGRTALHPAVILRNALPGGSIASTPHIP